MGGHINDKLYEFIDETIQCIISFSWQHRTSDSLCLEFLHVLLFVLKL